MPLVDPVTMSSEAPRPQTVQLHATTASQAARHVFPVVTGALFVAAFPSLVADPVAVMRNSLPLLFLLQTLHAFVCLPMAGSGAAKTRKPRPGDKKKAGDASGPNFVIVCLPRSCPVPSCEAS